jgi:hypothetical protein
MNFSLPNVITATIFIVPLLHSPLHVSAFYKAIFSWALFSCSLLHDMKFRLQRVNYFCWAVRRAMKWKTRPETQPKLFYIDIIYIHRRFMVDCVCAHACARTFYRSHAVSVETSSFHLHIWNYTIRKVNVRKKAKDAKSKGITSCRLSGAFSDVQSKGGTNIHVWRRNTGRGYRTRHGIIWYIRIHTDHAYSAEIRGEINVLSLGTKCQ